jgi:hypothetical protein
MVWAMYPKRMLLNVGYDGGRTIEVPRNLWKRHFGTPLLAAAQLQVVAILVYLVAGLVTVVLIDARAWRRHHSFNYILVKSKDMVGWSNVAIGILGSGALVLLNRMSYPEVMLRPEPFFGAFLDHPMWKRRLGRKKIVFLKEQVLADSKLMGWSLTVGSFGWLIFSVCAWSTWSNFLAAATSLVGSGFAWYSAYQEDSLLDPLLFGCHRCPLPSEHPMGPLFNEVTRADETIDVDAGLDAAAAVVGKLPWCEHKSGVGECCSAAWQR